MAQACRGGRGVSGGQHSPARSSWPSPPGLCGSGAGWLGARWARAAHSPRRRIPALSAAFNRLSATGQSGRSPCAAHAPPEPAPPPPACFAAAARVKGEDPGPQHFSVGTTGKGGRVPTPCLSFLRPPPDALLEKNPIRSAHPVLEPRIPTPHAVRSLVRVPRFLLPRSEQTDTVVETGRDEGDLRLASRIPLHPLPRPG